MIAVIERTQMLAEHNVPLAIRQHCGYCLKF